MMDVAQELMKDAVVGTEVAVFIGSDTIEIKQVEEVQPQLFKHILRVGSHWYDSSGAPCTVHGASIKWSTYWLGRLRPLTPDIVTHIEREALLYRLFGSRRALWGGQPLINRAQIDLLKEFVVRLDDLPEPIHSAPAERAER